MKGIARSTMGAFVVAGITIAATAAWCAPVDGVAEGADENVSEHVGEPAAASVNESAMPDAAASADDHAMPDAAMSAGENAMPGTAASAGDHAMPNAVGHVMENDAQGAAGSAVEKATESAPERTPESAPGKTGEGSTGDAAGTATENAAPHTAGTATEAAGMHMHHVVMPGTMHTTAEYTLPSVDLVRDDGKTVSLVKEVDDGRPVILTFIYTTCTTICPMISQTLERLQGELGPDRDKVHIVSISIDPEQDTPERLKAYAARFEAGPEWQHYTGTVEASIAAQRAFNVFRGDKMAHTPVTFMRAAPGQPWLRIDGFATPTELLAAYRDVVASN
ncbi:SCO family protein [Burkholderia pyrrocinia]|uniref:SCO family protein n=1 Tax=Burkholderia pyrrocinia TaxID=60550 RepID=UPI0015750DAF|nr:SCO family protein [Burkholderia pyrrocinia]NTX31260.1 SCO family protein [Burkholderia pyrrocinia]